MKKQGFTLAELLVSMIIMFVITGASVPILFKKQKKPKEDVKLNQIITTAQACSTTGTTKDINIAKDYPQYLSAEFFTIQLVGGGAAGGKYKGGNAGEVKTFYLPSMQGEYRIVTGYGGTSSSPSGGNTMFYKKNTDGTYTLIDYARGGISDNSGDSSSSAAGLEPSMETSFNNTNCGKGGNASYGDGYSGSAVIWL